MDEATKLYGEAAYLLDEIFKTCEEWEGGWDELINHLAAIDDSQFETERDFYYGYYKFLRNVYWRIKPWKEGQAFNQVSKKEVVKVRAGQLAHVEGYTIWNYDYKLFKWAVGRKLTWGMNPSMIDVAAEDLTEAERYRFNKMIEESK